MLTKAKAKTIVHAVCIHCGLLTVRHLVRLLAMTCLLLSAFLVGCDHSDPLAESEQPDTISIGSQTVITNKEDIGRFVSLFTDSQRRWQPYRFTISAKNLITVAVLKKDGKYLASVYIYSHDEHNDWVIVSANGSSPDSSPLTYSTKLTSEEHEDLLRLLKLEMPNTALVPTPTTP